MSEELVKNERQKQSSIKVNYVYNLIYKLMAVLVPILVTPQLSRVLEADGVGLQSYIASIASYFMLLAGAGIEIYGQREISMFRDDKAKIKKISLEISLLRIILTGVCLLIYYLAFVVPVFNKNNNLLYMIYGINILAVAFDFAWFFRGEENFKIISLIGFVVKAIYVLLTLVLVKTKSDLALASFLTVISAILPGVIIIPFMIKYIGKEKISKLQPFSHFKNSLIYFIPTIAIQIYTVLDKTMIGLITGSDFENGYYEQADKIVKIPLTIVTTMNVIISSRIAYYFYNRESDKIKKSIDKSLHFAFLLCFPMTFGMIAVAQKFVPIYLGTGYDKVVYLIYVLAPIMILICMSNLFGTHYFTPMGLQKISNKALIVGAIVNFICNLFLIYFFGSIGAAVGSVIAELIVTILYLYWGHTFYPVKKIIIISIKYLFASVVMFFVIFLTDKFFANNIRGLILEISCGIIAYITMLYVFVDKFILEITKNFFRKIKSLFR